MFHSRYSRRQVLAGGVAAIAAASVDRPRAVRAADEINALVWCDHSDPNLLNPFEEANGIKVNTKEFSATGEALAVLEQSKPGDWDVLVLDTVDIARLAEKGYLAELNDADYVKPGVLWWAFAPESARLQATDPNHAVNKDRLPDHAVVLIDEIDKADPDMPNGLLVPLGSNEFVVSETGTTVRA